jgi:hypothetical protein
MALDEDRLLVKDGWKHYRRTYSLGELRWGLAAGGALVAIALWVSWAGRHPAADRLEDATQLLEADKAASAGKPGQVALQIAEPRVGRGELRESGGDVKAVAAAGAASSGAAPAIPSPGAEEGGKAGERGPIPRDLAGAGWREEKVTSFDPDNLYVKIDGRADYFRGFGFTQLYSLLLVDAANPANTIDVEVYDQGRSPNALGAYGGERGAEVKPEVSDSGFRHFERNALYLARGPYYIRVIGSDETPVIKAKLAELATKLEVGIPGEALPWAYGLFIGGLGLDPGMVAYYAESAFSLGFATDVWAARPGGKDSDLEIFVNALATPAAAKQRASAFAKGFLEIGEPAGTLAGGKLVKDRYLSTLALAVPEDRFVVGVRGATDQAMVEKELARLREALGKLTPEQKARAKPVGKAKAAGKGAGGGDHE